MMKGEKTLVSDLSTTVNHHNQIVLSIEKRFSGNHVKTHSASTVFRYKQRNII